MNPIDFRGQRSKVKVTMEIYGNKLVKARGCYALRCYIFSLYFEMIIFNAKYCCIFKNSGTAACIFNKKKLKADNISSIDDEVL